METAYVPVNGFVYREPVPSVPSLPLNLSIHAPSSSRPRFPRLGLLSRPDASPFSLLNPTDPLRPAETPPILRAAAESIFGWLDSRHDFELIIATVRRKGPIERASE